MGSKPKPVASANPPTTWRELLPVHPAAETSPMMSQAKLNALAKDIKKTTLRQLVVIGIDSEKKQWWLDGRNRLAALALLGVHPTRRVLRRGHEPEIAFADSDVIEQPFGLGVTYHYEDDGDFFEYVASANIHRRQLDPEDERRGLEVVRTAREKRQALEDALKVNWRLSDRKIAKKLNCDNKTVAAARARLEDTEEIPQCDARIGEDNREQPAHKPPQTGSGSTPGQTSITAAQRQAEAAADELANAQPNNAEQTIDLDPPADPPGLGTERPALENAQPEHEPPTPKAPPAKPPIRSPSGRPNASAPKATTWVDIMAAWMSAPRDEHARAVNNIGGRELLAHFPDDWVPAVEEWLASKQAPPVLH